VFLILTIKETGESILKGGGCGRAALKPARKGRIDKESSHLSRIALVNTTREEVPRRTEKRTIKDCTSGERKCRPFYEKVEKVGEHPRYYAEGPRSFREKMASCA